jgi:hypothetical protein
MALFFLLFLVSSSSYAASAPASEFARASLSASSWPVASAASTAPFAVGSPVECAGFCVSAANCSAFVFVAQAVQCSYGRAEDIFAASNPAGPLQLSVYLETSEICSLGL